MAGPRPRRDLLTVAPARGGVWEQPVHVLLDAADVIVPGEPPLPWEDRSRSGEIAAFVLWSALNQARPDRAGGLLVLEVRPFLIVHVAPTAVERYWAIRFHLARAGIRTRFVLLNDWERTGLRAPMLEYVPVPRWYSEAGQSSGG